MNNVTQNGTSSDFSTPLANKNASLKCAVCEKQYSLSLRYRCGACDGVLNVVYAGTQQIKSGFGIERFEDFLPLKIQEPFLCPETPCVRFDNRNYLEHNGVFCKVEGALETALK